MKRNNNFINFIFYTFHAFILFSKGKCRLPQSHKRM